MKKTLTIVALIMIITMLTLGGVKAATSSTLADEIYALLSGYGMTSGQKVEMQRYLNSNPVSDEQANAILSDAKGAVSVMQEEGVTNINDLSGEAKNKVKNLAQAAASEAGLSISFKDGVATITNSNGDVVATLGETGKLAYTGNNVNMVLVVSSVAVIALAATVVSKKRIGA